MSRFQFIEQLSEACLQELSDKTKDYAAKQLLVKAEEKLKIARSMEDLGMGWNTHMRKVIDRLRKEANKHANTASNHITKL